MKRQNGHGTVTNEGGKLRARVAVVVDGKKTQKTIGWYTTKEAAEDALKDYRRNPYDVDAKKATFREVYEKWTATRPPLSVGRLAGFKSGFKKLTALHSRPFVSLRLTDYRPIINTVAPYTKILIKAFLGHLYNFAIFELDITEKDYSKGITLKTPARERDPIIITAGVIGQIWERAHRDNQTAVMILIMLYSGWRVGEMCGLLKKNVDLKARTMRGGSKTKAGINRVVPIHSAILPFITRLMETEGAHLVTDRRGRAVKTQTFRNRFIALMEVMDAPAHRPHDTRHTFRSALGAASVGDLARINKIMGHGSPDIGLSTYSHSNLVEDRRVVELVDYTDRPAPVVDVETRPRATNNWGIDAVQTSMFQAVV